MEREQENNPDDRLAYGRAVEVNEFIQQLLDGQNDEDRARILLMMQNIVANEHVINAIPIPVHVHV
jgi:hypothetical protein